MKTILVIDVVNNSPSDGWIYKLITVPLAGNMDAIVSFTYTVIAFLALLIAYRIYANWQAGTSENTLSEISRWFIGMILCIALISGLKTWVSLQPVPVGVTINFK